MMYRGGYAVVGLDLSDGYGAARRILSVSILSVSGVGGAERYWTGSLATSGAGAQDVPDPYDGEFFVFESVSDLSGAVYGLLVGRTAVVSNVDVLTLLTSALGVTFQGTICNISEMADRNLPSLKEHDLPTLREYFRVQTKLSEGSRSESDSLWQIYKLLTQLEAIGTKSPSAGAFPQGVAATARPHVTEAKPVQPTGNLNPASQAAPHVIGSGLAFEANRATGLRVPTALEVSTPAHAVGTPQPGWYIDPLGSGSLRLWDENRWTQFLYELKPSAPDDQFVLSQQDAPDAGLTGPFASGVYDTAPTSYVSSPVAQAQGSQQYCGSCGAIMNATSKFCGACGFVASRACPTCAFSDHIAGARFCIKCSTQLGA